jgi:protein TonB
MKGFIAFLALSTAVHAGILIGLPEEGAVAGQGAEGRDILSLTPAAASHAALIEAWETPPDVVPAVQPITPAAVATYVSEISPEASVQRRFSTPMPQPAADARPELATSPLAALPSPDAAISEAPTFSLPSLAEGLAAPSLDDTPLHGRSPQPLTAPTLDAVEPQPDTEPHFEGSTALATASSPRPRARPEGLTPAPEPQPQPQQPPQDPAPARVAAGAGGGVSQGAATAAAPPQSTVSAAQVQSAMATWGGQIQARIARARPNVGATGRAVVQLAVAPSGQLVGLGLARSSGNGAIDQAALDAVRRAGGFPRAPDVLTDASYTFSVPLSFQ